jgi:hypothetical protein
VYDNNPRRTVRLGSEYRKYHLQDTSYLSGRLMRVEDNILLFGLFFEPQDGSKISYRSVCLISTA